MNTWAWTWGLSTSLPTATASSTAGSQLLGIRERRFRQRRRLQAKGSKRARRLLRRLSGREGRMVRQENHRIAKEIVTRAQRTGRGIALEGLGASGTG